MVRCSNDNCRELLGTHPTEDPDTGAVKHQYRERGVAKSEHYCSLECVIKGNAELAKRVLDR
jgi:hypothetical protein